MPGIVEVGFDSSVKPRLSFEIMKFSELTARVLPHPISAPTRFTFHLVYYGVTGKTRHAIDFEQFTIAPHDMVFVSPGRVQQYDLAPGLEMWMLLFTPDFVDLPGCQVLSPFWVPPKLSVPPSERKELTQLILQLRAEYARPTDAVQPALLAALLRSFLLRCERLAAQSQSQKRVSPELEQFRELLERDHARTRNVDDYAKAIGVSARTLNGLTQKRFGRSAKEYIDERVVLELKRLLAHSDLPVKALAARFGFSDPTNLVKFFRHHTNKTPVAFREAVSGS